MSSIDIYYDGLTNILNFDEYKDLDKARDFMSLVEDRDSLFQILKMTLSPAMLKLLLDQKIAQVS